MSSGPTQTLSLDAPFQASIMSVASGLWGARLGLALVSTTGIVVALDQAPFAAPSVAVEMVLSATPFQARWMLPVRPAPNAGPDTVLKSGEAVLAAPQPAAPSGIHQMLLSLSPFQAQ